MSSDDFKKSERSEAVTKKLTPVEQPNPTYDEIRRAVQDGNYVIDFRRLSTIMAKRLGWDTTHH